MCKRIVLMAIAVLLGLPGLLPEMAQAQSADGGFNPGANNAVHALAVQPDGRILAGGDFTQLGGSIRNRLGRLNSDGALDTNFNPTANNAVYALAVQPDGRILVGGDFTALAGATRNRIGRLNPDGTIDTTFNPDANGRVSAIAVQPDGGIILGGSFTALGGATRNRIGRLNPDGSLDTAFNPGAEGTVYAVAVQPDEKILVGGEFTQLGGQARNRIGRLAPGGALDAAFNPGANNFVEAFALQADGRILVGGSFTQLGGATRSRLGRLNSDGTLDTNFNPTANNAVHTLAVQADGKILIGGEFIQLSGSTRNRIGRFNADGALDTAFNPVANDAVFALALQPDGRVLVGGDFTQLGGQSRNAVGRLTNTDDTSQTLVITINGDAIQWLRGGAGPELQRVTFESSADSVNYTLLGNAARIAGGWELTGLVLPDDQNLLIRARGFYSTGRYNGSGSVVEAIRNASVPGAVATVSAASFRQSEPLAANSIVAAFGAAMALGQEAANTSPLPLVLLGTSVQVRDGGGVSRPAPLFFVSPGQINYLIPEGTAPGEATVSVTSGNGQISIGTIRIVAVSPGLFTANSDGSGIAAAQALRVTSTGAQIFEEVAQFDAASNRYVEKCAGLGPVEEAVYLVLYGTGIRGLTSISGVTATIGGTTVPVLFVGAQGQFIGLDQINLGPIPRQLIGRGAVDVVLTVDGQPANTVRICIG